MCEVGSTAQLKPPSFPDDGLGGDGWGAMVATLVLGQTLHYFAGHMTKFQELAQLMLRREVLWISVGSHQEQ